MNISKKTIYLFFSLLVTLSYGQQGTLDQLNVSDLDMSKIEQPWWTAQKNRAITGEKISISGKEFTHGIGTISRSKLFIFLDGKSKTFTTEVGIQDSEVKNGPFKFNALGDGTKLFYEENSKGKTFVGIANTETSIEKGSVIFIIKGDDKILWKSKKIKGGEQAVSLNISVKGINVLELIVEDTGDGVSGDHAIWANAKLMFNGYKPQIVDGNYLNRMKVADRAFNSKLEPLIKKLPEPTPQYVDGIKKDWLIDNISLASKVFRSKNNKEITISNGLVSRTFRITPNCATVDFKNLVNGESLLRGVSPEAMVQIDDIEYQVGGLDGQVEYGYLKKEWLEQMWSPKNSFQIENFRIENIKPRLDWKNKRWALEEKDDLKGKELIFEYAHSDLQNVKIEVHYEIYDGIPLISKWITIENNSSKEVILNNFKSEILATVEPESAVERGETGWELPNIHVESDFAFHAMSFKGSNQVVNWEKDPRYTSQTNYPRLMPCLLECKLPIGPNETIDKGSNFESFRVWEMPFDSYDKQRKGLATNRFYNLVAPWTSENPLFLHLTTTDENKVKAAIDQCVDTGYEMVILSFGSGLNMEDISDKNIAKFKGLADYAHSKGIELGGYSLLSSRWISDEVDVINPETGKRGGVIHGSSPCLNSQWGIDYFQKLKTFFEKTGFDLLEHDGSYPGQLCASTTHVAHKNVEDSQWKAWKRISNFYKWCNEKGISLNIPDWYYLSGSTKNGIGYREVNWSLPRERQLVLGRQNIYDGTWDRTPSMSWTFVPLTQYHGGGAAATIEPLNDHLDAYEAHMVQNYGSGVQACYRGPRLYDTERTKEAVIDIVEWYKTYRNILNSPIVHLKRANGREIDGIMHVNPELKEKGFVQFFNPTATSIKKIVKIPLYYTGLKTTAKVREQEGKSKEYILDRGYNITMEIEVPANGNTWFVIE
ncbi:NPCBM/NEW2 domain-containing protein [Maribacter ulvicola]|uniref:NPCBM/NEW2 domain-containing protein n=1 Tax=Maribacter ulvicola TaxID=228959 RepID=A0A1N6ZZV9_9FLAO|nr:NPCBM/NEW2 domain-containing protein [Maribacter ulvicola]SIR32296.1 NPCBM/NEW2 domain-containing protein [Maribacter ulvicola]